MFTHFVIYFSSLFSSYLRERDNKKERDFACASSLPKGWGQTEARIPRPSRPPVWESGAQAPEPPPAGPRVPEQEAG